MIRHSKDLSNQKYSAFLVVEGAFKKHDIGRGLRNLR